MTGYFDDAGTIPFVTNTESGQVSNQVNGPAPGAGAASTTSLFSVSADLQNTDGITTYQFPVSSQTSAQIAGQQSIATDSTARDLTISNNSSTTLDKNFLTIGFTASITAQNPDFFRNPSLTFDSTYIDITINGVDGSGTFVPGLVITNAMTGAIISQDTSFGATTAADTSSVQYTVAFPNVASVAFEASYTSNLTTGFYNGPNNVVIVPPNTSVHQTSDFNYSVNFALH